MTGLDLGRSASGRVSAQPELCCPIWPIPKKPTDWTSWRKARDLQDSQAGRVYRGSSFVALAADCGLNRRPGSRSRLPCASDSPSPNWRSSVNRHRCSCLDWRAAFLMSAVLAGVCPAAVASEQVRPTHPPSASSRRSGTLAEPSVGKNTEVRALIGEAAAQAFEGRVPLEIREAAKTVGSSTWPSRG